MLARTSVIARQALLELDTLLATATSGWRTLLLMQEHPPPNTPLRVSRLSPVRVFEFDPDASEAYN